MGVIGSITITSSLVINRDEKTAALHREATRLKEIGDWNSAIAALREAQERMRSSNFMNTTESWVRLPLFLQQAGQFDEAMAEFNRLLNEVDALKAKENSQFPERFWPGFTHHPKAVIYDKMKISCKRQKLPEEAEKYEALRDKEREKAEKFNTKFDAWHRKDMTYKRTELEKKYQSTRK